MDQAEDPFLWLEEERGPRALAWVEAENARTLAVLKGDPRYEGFHAEALRLLTAPDRIPMPGQIGGLIYNFWQDEAHVRGLWRRTTPASYASSEPDWEAVLDVDALASEEKANWVLMGVRTLGPEHRRCLVSLSNGGEDANVVREFDLAARTFIEGGFVLPTGKQWEDWLDEDALLVAREWGPGTMTPSGYPFVVKRLARGRPLEEAVEVFRGRTEDMLARPLAMRDAEGRSLALIIRAVDFYHEEVHELAAGGLRRLNLPAKVDLRDWLGGRLVFRILEDWRGFRAGDLLAVPPDELAAEEPRSSPDWLVVSPGSRETVSQATATARRLVVAMLENVNASVRAFSHAQGGGWSSRPLPTPPHASATIVSASDVDDTLYYAVESFLEPTRLMRADAASGEATGVKQLPARFDAVGATVEQLDAVSSDGTAIPYFVFRPREIRHDGSNPTLLYAYGGFDASLTPAYSPTIGRLWVSRGGAYVLANIRGGGEFGPAWHEAGLKTRRQIIYDDFAAVANDLIARKIASPRRLGIQGGSNGGLLMGVQFNQRPELWRAVAIEVPLLDMLRFEKIGAGASWTAEYGSVEVPEERAFLERISPYHNLRAGAAYPEPFFVTATSDDRVSPVHARKMAAKMQSMGLPFLYFENTDGGHAASANLKQRAERIALEFTYFTRKLMD